MTARFIKRSMEPSKTEPFKVSKKSICHTCKNYNNKCSLKVFKLCETDSKAGLAYVKKCQEFKEKQD